MRTFFRIACCLFSGLSSCLTVANGAVISEDRSPAPRIEIAILLDTSSSMDGLIDQAREHIWRIVNDCAAARKGGRIPDLRVAVYQYGNDALSVDGNWIEQVQPLTTDLDAISESLFALTTNGGTETCGAVIAHAVDHLEWTTGADYRAIFIAGNEPFDQGPIDYRGACRTALAQGIVINTIHCGSETDGRSGHWYTAARLGEGQCITINHNHRETAVPAPQDDRIHELNTQLNNTYIIYGADGAVAAERQQAQDANAASMSSSALAARVIAKAGTNYRNSRWDLVDAVAQEEVDLDRLGNDELPESLREMSPEERLAYVQTKATERARLQAELQELARARTAFLAAERAKRVSTDSDNTFVQAVRAAMADQLNAAGFALDPDHTTGP